MRREYGCLYNKTDVSKVVFHPLVEKRSSLLFRIVKRDSFMKFVPDLLEREGLLLEACAADGEPAEQKTRRQLRASRQRRRQARGVADGVNGRRRTFQRIFSVASLGCTRPLADWETALKKKTLVQLF